MTETSKPRRRKVHETTLVIAEYGGDYGLLPKWVANNQREEEFQPFTSARGIFHDVFEHWFEGEHISFRGEAALTVGGEIAAMGAYLYYTERGVVPSSGFSDHQDIALRTTLDLLDDGVQYPVPVSHVGRIPKQDSRMEEYLRLYLERLGAKRAKAEERHAELTESFGDPDQMLFPFEEEPARWLGYALQESESVVERLRGTDRKAVVNLHRWGWVQARRIVPPGFRTEDLHDFSLFWDQFRSPDFERFSSCYRELVFKIYHTGRSVEWSALFVPDRFSEFKPLKYRSWVDDPIPKAREILSSIPY